MTAFTPSRDVMNFKMHKKSGYSQDQRIFMQQSEALCFLYKHISLAPQDVYQKERNNKHITESSRKFFSWTLHKYTLKQTNNATDWYIIVLIGRTKLYLQY
jgi:hypothetical protein